MLNCSPRERHVIYLDSMERVWRLVRIVATRKKLDTKLQLNFQRILCLMRILRTARYPILLILPCLYGIECEDGCIRNHLPLLPDGVGAMVAMNGYGGDDRNKLVLGPVLARGDGDERSKIKLLADVKTKS